MDSDQARTRDGRSGLEEPLDPTTNDEPRRGGGVEALGAGALGGAAIGGVVAGAPGALIGGLVGAAAGAAADTTEAGDADAPTDPQDDREPG